MSLFFTRASTMKAQSSTQPVSAYPFTMACRMRTTNLTNNMGVMSIHAGAVTPRRHVLILVAGAVRFYAEDATNAQNATSAGTVTSGAWHSVAAVATSSTDRAAWLDGSAGATATTSITFDNANINALTYGWDGFDTLNYYDGDIAEAGVWNVALTAAELASLNRGVSPLAVRPSALVRYYPLIGRPTTEPDLRNGFGLTLTNSPTASAHPRVYKPKRRDALIGTVAAGGGSAKAAGIYHRLLSQAY